MTLKTMRRARTRLPGQRERVELKRKQLPELLRSIWGLDIKNVRQPTAYQLPYDQLLSIVDTSLLLLPDRDSVVGLLQVVKSNCDLPLQQLKELLKSPNGQWVTARGGDRAASRAIELAIQLWLMILPRADSLLNGNLQLKDIVSQSFDIPTMASPHTTKAPQYDRLSADFEAKNLIRIGGIEIIWTSFLSEHLLVTGDQLKVFAHGSLVREYSRSKERGLYPDGLLEETYETLDLLFPCTDKKDSKRARRLRDKDDVDIEAANRLLPPSIMLNHYKHWGRRLAIVQQIYDNARPKRPKQWWFDRRNRVEWATLVVAVTVFILTLVFGVISSVTGILQVIASSRG